MTLVELLVVLGILSVVVGMTVVAVVMMRERSRMTQCQSNLRQIGLAMHAHHDLRGCFAETNPRPIRQFKQVGAFGQWLPFLGERTLYDSLPKGRFFESRSAEREFPQIVSVLLCPSDTPAHGTNYRLCYGDTESLLMHPHDGIEPHTGTFGTKGRIESSAITDGLSNTIGLSEKLRSQQASVFEPDAHTWYLATVMPSTRESDALIRVCADPPASPARFLFHGGTTYLATHAEVIGYNHLLPPNAPGVDCAAKTPHVGIYRATSHHSGGVHFLRMDGSVDFASDNVDVIVWRAAATPSGQD